MAYNNEETTSARIFKSTKTSIQKAIQIISKDSKGRITEAIAIDEALKSFVAEREKNGK